MPRITSGRWTATRRSRRRSRAGAEALAAVMRYLLKLQSGSSHSLGKKSVHAIQNFNGRARSVNVSAQLGAIAHAVREIARELFHFTDGVGPFGVDQIPEIRGEQLIAVPLARFVVGTGGGELRDLAENPRIIGSGAANHHGVAAGFAEHAHGVLRRIDIAVADHRHAHGALDVTNHVPIGAPGVALLARRSEE